MIIYNGEKIINLLYNFGYFSPPYYKIYKIKNEIYL